MQYALWGNTEVLHVNAKLIVRECSPRLSGAGGNCGESPDPSEDPLQDIPEKRLKVVFHTLTMQQEIPFSDGFTTTQQSLESSGAGQRRMQGQDIIH